MQLRRRIKTARPNDNNEFDKTLEQELLSAWAELATLVNNGLRFEDNFDAEIVDVPDTGTANTEFIVMHNLKRVPIGYLVIGSDKATMVYNGTTAWTSADIYLKSSTANCILKVMVF